jgi:TolC family type I secretion outer membrane protein
MEIDTGNSARRAGWRRPAAAIAVASALAALAAPVQSQPASPAAAAPASASTTPAVPPLTLEQAYRIALEQDAVIRAAQAVAAGKRERLPQARAQLLPQISADVSRYKNNLSSVTPGFGGVPFESTQKYFSSTKSLTIRQALYRPFNLADYRQAKVQVDDANAALDKEVQNVAVRVVNAYLNVLLADEQLALALAQKESYTAQVDAARKSLAAGSGVRTDIDQAQASLDMAIAQELQARQNLDYTRRQLQVMVNRPVTNLAHLNADRLRTAPDPGTLQSWTDRAEQASPELRSMRAQREVAHYEVEKAQAGHKPTLDAVVQWSISDSDNVTRVNSHYDSKAVGLQLHVPIYSGGYVNSQVRQALAEVERSSAAYDATRRDLALRVEKEYRGITEGTLTVRALEQAVRSAETMVVSTRRSFQAGSRTLLDVLTAEQQRATALRDLANARYQFVQAQINIRALAGEADDNAVRQLDGWLTQ